MSPARSLLSILLLALALAGHGAARGDAAALQDGMAVVLCGDGTDRTVILDPQGRPVLPAAHCPDCVVPADAPLPGAAQAVQRQARGRACRRPCRTASPHPRPLRRPRCRAPPALS